MTSDLELKERWLAWKGTECICNLCGRRTTEGCLQFWGDLGLCEFCDALEGDRYEFDMALERLRMVGVKHLTADRPLY